MFARGREVGERAKWMKGRGRYRLPVMKGLSHRDERHSTGDTVSAIVIVLYGDRWELHLW